MVAIMPYLQLGSFHMQLKYYVFKLTFVPFPWEQFILWSSAYSPIQHATITISPNNGNEVAVYFFLLKKEKITTAQQQWQ